MSKQDLDFAQSKYRELFVSDEHILAAQARCTFFEPSGELAVAHIVERIQQALAKRAPLSLIRVGNGEGNAIAMVDDPGPEPVFNAFDVEFVSQNGWPIGASAAASFSREVVAAITAADIQGYRIHRVDEDVLVRKCLQRGAFSPAIGITYARALFARQIDAAGRTGWFTNAWIHFDLARQLEAILREARSVVVVTGRQTLESGFRQRLGTRLQQFIGVPVQGYIPSAFGDSHFARFEEVRASIRSLDLSGSLMLVGAGLFGKVYCSDARQCGAVALDLGSAFDLLAGVASRPIHRQIDVEDLRW